MKPYKTLFSFIVLISFSISVNAQWSNGIVPYFRDANAIAILDNYHAAIAGGHETNDSIQSVFISSDRGTTWMVNQDVLKAWLKSISYVSDSNLVAVGYDGNIIRSTDGGNTWSAIAAPGNTYSRNFNSVFFVNDTIGYIAGGWPSDDSIQTILKTTDGGATWNIQRDNLGYWLHSIYFSDATHGYAVGDNGVVLQTTDGGSNWNTVTIPGNAGTRNYNAVYAQNNTTAIIVGGNLSNDSIQTILKTTDGGANWNVVLDNLGPMLNGIDFAGSAKAYIVGNKGVILESNNSGDNWSPVSLPGSVVDTLDLNAVNFYNTDFGIAVGKNGAMLIYNNPLPTAPSVTTLPATAVTTSSATLNAKVNPNGSYAAAYFEYGTTPLLGTTVTAVPDTVTGSTWQNVSVNLSSLATNTIYYYRAKAENAGGNNIDTIRQFYTGGCGIPNCSFDDWDTISTDYPQGWQFDGRPMKVSSYNGTNAVKLTTQADGQVSVIFLGIQNKNGYPQEGGMPVSGQPDSLTFYANYNIDAGDTAYVLSVFKANDQPIYTDFHPITGSSGGNFVPVTFAYHFPNSTAPDSVVLGFVNSSPFVETPPTNNSMLTLDDVRFIGINSPIPNGDFEQWQTDVRPYPNVWFTTQGDNLVPGIYPFIPTTDKVAGRYALKMSATPDGRSFRVSTSPMNQNFGIPSFPVSGKHITLNLYLKYHKENTDTAQVMLALFKAGVQIGGAYLSLDSSVTNYTAYSLPINYSNQTDIPDSATISIGIGNDSATGNSVLYVDDLSFDGFGPVDGLQALSTEAGSFFIYPNPANDLLQVGWQLNSQEPVHISLTDINGRVVKSELAPTTAGQATLDVSDLAAGFYIVTLRSGKYAANRKLIISK